MPATYYPAVIDRSASGFGVSFPDFPGCIAAGVTINEAALNAEGALALHVEAMVKDKDALPAPSTLDDIEVGLDGADDVACVLVRVDAPAKVERVLISLDAGLLRAIDAVAQNRSAWMADAARAAMSTGQVAAGILGQGELATKGFRDIEERYGLKPRAEKPSKPANPSARDVTQRAAVVRDAESGRLSPSVPGAGSHKKRA